MKHTMIKTLLLAALALPFIAGGQNPVDPDPTGILRKPIPDKLVVLTFDDGPASGYTVVAPILKSFGFCGSFYVCDFDSFRTRKDWYLTWRQMKAMAEAGFEIGNHSAGHFSGLEPTLIMEDELLANHVPKPTTIAWPLSVADMTSVSGLVANGYIFARGGYNHPYSPLVDNGFDIPSMASYNMEDFVKMVRQAADGRIVVICYHGVPDMEHAACSVEPAIFREMMRYLKDNNYKVIALRDLAEYIDPAKAAKLPPTAKEFKPSGPVVLAEEVKPHVAEAGIQRFGFPNLNPGMISQTKIEVTVPHAMDVTALAPDITIPAGATVVPDHKTVRDFTKQQTYTLTGNDGSSKTYTVIVNKDAASTAKDMLTFVLPGAGSTPVSSTSIGVSVPITAEVTKLAPSFTLSPFAQAVPASGTVRDFTHPQTYVVTAQDGSAQVYTVTVVKSRQPNAFIWGKAEAGTWSDASKWSNNLGKESAPVASGQADYILNFNQTGKCVVTNDLNEGFLLNELNLETGRGNGLTLTGKSLTFARNIVASVPPGIIQRFLQQKDEINVPIKLASDIHVVSPERSFLRVEGAISGDYRLIYDGHGTVFDGGANANHSTLFIATKGINTYSGGTIINGGRVWQFGCSQPLGTGPVTINGGEIVCCKMANPLIVNGGRISGGGTEWDAPITVNAMATLDGSASFNQTSGGISGPGGLTMEGTWSTWTIVNKGIVSLYGTNTYTGPTTILMGMIAVKKAASLYNADSTKWTPANISVANGATLSISAGGPGEFTGAQVGTLLKNLTTSINTNGLTAGSVICLDTTSTNEPVTVSANIADSKGPGGGAFVVKKCGKGTLQFSGKNDYTGQTILESGALSVASFNSFTKGKGKPSSSLGAPTDIEAGEVVIGEEGKDGECSLVYTGTGETSDRVMNLTGKNSTVIFDQSGSGLLKLTSPFLISGYGVNKTIALTGDTAGKGEIVGNIANPYDRSGKATTSVTKSGMGTWTLSGTNSYSGQNKVAGGVLAYAKTTALGSGPLDISSGAKLQLNYSGTRYISALTLNGGSAQAAGTYGSTTSSATHKNDACFSGPGAVAVAP